MKCYLVGGSVRDKLQGLEAHDRDWVVVGTTPEEMLQQGFFQFKNKFPVFLHPDNKEEYALARTETKTGSGYNGFSFNIAPDISLEEDLKRRDLTINAIAESTDGTLIDPFNGINDLKNKTLRHVSDSFVEDPFRLLRVCRFMARFAHLGFNVAPETMQLMCKMVNAGSLKELKAEEIWKEMEKALGEKNPEKFFETLSQCGALSFLFPSFCIDENAINALKQAVKLTNDPVVRFAALVYSKVKNQAEREEIEKMINLFCNLIRTPHAYRQLASLVAIYYKNVLRASTVSPELLLQLFTDLNIFSNTSSFFNNQKLFDSFLAACHAIANAQNIKFEPAWLIDCVRQAKSFNSRELFQAGMKGELLRNKIKEKRLKIIHEYLNQFVQTCNDFSNVNYKYNKP